MKVKIIGFSNIDIKESKTTGKPFKATTIYALEEITSDYGKGYRYLGRYDRQNGSIRPFVVYDNVHPMGDFVVNADYDISFNSSGNIDSVKKL